MSDGWSSAQFTETLPALSVTPETNRRVRVYAKNHNMKLAEVMRKAVSLFLADEIAKGEQFIPKVEIKTRKKSKKGGKTS